MPVGVIIRPANKIGDKDPTPLPLTAKPKA
jgi:hypothetical protein